MSLRRLRSLKHSRGQTTLSTESSSAGMPPLKGLRASSAETLSSPGTQTRSLSKLPPLDESAWRILDFDLETLAAGFADPEWVPQKITVAAWSWIGEEEVHYATALKPGFFDRRLRVRALMPLVKAIWEADVVTGHNLLRFDLPVLNAELMRAGLNPLPNLWVQDTMKFPKSKGLKKSQDDVSLMVGSEQRKLSLNWEEWDRAYEVKGWPLVIERCKTDVLAHKEMREGLAAQNALDKPRKWRSRKP